ncbi:hypothetical protein [Mycolicibacterium sp. XJ870]
MPTKYRQRSTVRRPAPRHIGSIELIDLDIICRFYGRDFLPYPFMLTRPTRFSFHEEYTRYSNSVPDRFNHGDLQKFRRWAASYAYADIRVECHVQFIPSSIPSLRVVGNRVGGLGYLAKQRSDEDIIDVYEVSPYDLGHAIADSVELVKPGRHHEIVIPEYKSSSRTDTQPEHFNLRQVADQSTARVVRRAEVTAFGSVQTHWRPTRRWGLDRGKNAAVWVRIKDDGEYRFEVDFDRAKPMTRPSLAERIDELIAEDVAVLRDIKNFERTGESG